MLHFAPRWYCSLLTGIMRSTSHDPVSVSSQFGESVKSFYGKVRLTDTQNRNKKWTYFYHLTLKQFIAVWANASILHILQSQTLSLLSQLNSILVAWYHCMGECCQMYSATNQLWLIILSAWFKNNKKQTAGVSKS